MSLDLSREDLGLELSELNFITKVLFNVDYYRVLTGQVILNLEQENILSSLAKEYKSGRPLEYLLAKSHFFGLDLEVNQKVLIPRKETEILVEETIKFSQGRKALSILEIGTGSGNIALALAKELPGSWVFSSEISREALGVASGNARNYNLDNLFFINGDLLSSFKKNTFDLIVSNPPYVQQSWIEQNPGLSFEPRLALSGGKDGLLVIKQILAQARQYLKSGGRLFMEIGINQKDPVLDYAEGKGWFLEQVVKDYAGIERIVVFSNRE